MQRPVTSRASKNSMLGKSRVSLTETQTKDKKGCEGQFEGTQPKSIQDEENFLVVTFKMNWI